MSGFEVWVCGDYQDAGERYKINIAHQLESFAWRVELLICKSFIIDIKGFLMICRWS